MTFKDPVERPLFLSFDDTADYADVPDNSVPRACNNDYDHFLLDDSIFDIQPPPFTDDTGKDSEGEGVPLESQPTRLIMKPWLGSTSLLSSASLTGLPPSKETSAALPACETHDTARLTEDQEPARVDPFADDLAELEAWLHSSAVELVDHVD